MMRTVTLPLLLLLFLVGCSAGKVLQRRDAALKVGYVAFLPAKAPKGLKPERVALVQSLVENELRRRGYLVVEERHLAARCAEGACPKVDELIRRFGVDAVVQLELTSAESRNLVVGYADSIAGTLSFTGAGGKVLESVTQKSRRTGGLLLNSGQIVEAIETQSESFRDRTFEPLAREFSRSLVAAVSTPSGIEARVAPQLLTIGDVQLEKGAQQEKVCLQGTPASVLMLIGERGQAQLREVREGSYCGALQSVRPVVAMPFRAELRTPAGLQTEKRFPPIVMDPTKCRLNGLLVYFAKLRSLQLKCEIDECRERFQACQSARKVVFRADSARGPFRRVGEFTGALFLDRSKGEVAPLYSVILKSPGLLESNQPVLLATGSNQ